MNFQGSLPAGVRAVKITVFSSNGTWTPDAKLIFADIEAYAGGGGGGGVTGTTNQAFGGGGGGAGGKSRRMLSRAAAGASKAVVIGAGGTGSSGANGNNGADTTLGGDTVTMTIASPAVVSLTAHGLAVNDPISFATSGALPTGVVAGTVYYVISAGLTANAFQFSASVGGAAVNTSGTQSGTHTLNLIVAKGGSGGVLGSNGTGTTGGNGGVTTTAVGDDCMPGNPGHAGYYVTTTGTYLLASGIGGGTDRGGQGKGLIPASNSNTAGVAAAVNSGSGGSGAANHNTNATSAAGGAGGSGFVRVAEYLSG